MDDRTDLQLKSYGINRFRFGVAVVVVVVVWTADDADLVAF